jgi:hypothetical protein
MVFDNIFNFANKGTGIFSVDGPGTKPKPSVDDFEDAAEDTYEDTYEDNHGSLFSSGIHGASSKAKVLQEQSPEARNILRFIGDFIGTTQRIADQQREHAQKPESVSEMASAGMKKSSETVKKSSDLQKDDDLDRPKKSDFTTPTAPKATAEAAPAPPKATAEAAPAPPKATAEAAPAPPKATAEQPSQRNHRSGTPSITLTSSTPHTRSARSRLTASTPD